MALFTKIIPSITSEKKKGLFFDSIFIDMNGHGCTAIDDDADDLCRERDDDRRSNNNSNININNNNSAGKEPADSILFFTKEPNKSDSIKSRNEKSMASYKQIADRKQSDGRMNETNSSSHSRNNKENSSMNSNNPIISDIISHANLIRRSATGALILEPRGTIDERFITSRSGVIATTSASAKDATTTTTDGDDAVDGLDDTVSGDGNDEEGGDDERADSYIEVLFSRVRHNHIQYVLHALEQGFDINAIDQNGNSIAHICAQNNHRKLLHAIIEKYPWIDLNRRNKKHCTALDYCEKYGFLKMYDWLVVEGAFHGRELAVIAPKRSQNHHLR